MHIKTMLYGASLSLAFTMSAQADVSASIVNLGDVGAGGNTYQVFVNLDAAETLLAVGGNAAVSSLIFDASGDLIQNQLIPGALGDSPTTGIVQAGDSWVTIGDPSSHNTAFSPGFAGGDGVASVINGSYFEHLDNGGYFDQNPGTAEMGSVLIAQFTLAEGDTFSYQGTASYNDAGGTLTSAAFAVTTVPTPGALALLGLAGLASRRRRRD